MCAQKQRVIFYTKSFEGHSLFREFNAWMNQTLSTAVLLTFVFYSQEIGVQENKNKFLELSLIYIWNINKLKWLVRMKQKPTISEEILQLREKDMLTQS